MNNWESIKIGEIGKIVTGKTPATIDPLNYGSDYMFIGPTDLHKHFIISESDKMITTKGLLSIKGSIIDGLSILVGCIGWDMGNVAIVNGKCATNQQINSITQIKESYNPFYIYYWFKQKKQYLFQIASVTRTPLLKKSDFANIELNIPNKNQQDKVSNTLIALDTKIELNNRINAELEAMAKTLYDYWFVQFDFPNAEGKPYKSSGGTMVWSEELKREIPEGWEVGTLENLGDFKNGINYDPKIKGNSFAKIINVRNISSSNLFISQFELDEIELKESEINNYLVTQKDILIARSGIPGATRLMNEFETNTIYCGFIIRFQVRKLEDRNYLFFFLKDMEKSTGVKSAGTIMQNVNQDTLKRLLLVLPDKNMLKRFNDLIYPIFEQINTVTKENQQLAQLRDWLLPMLMNGQVVVE